MLAVTLEHWQDGVKTDPRFVKFVSHLWHYTGREFIKKSYPMHACTEREFARFNPVV